MRCLNRIFTVYLHDVLSKFLFIDTPIVGVCNCSMFCCTLLYVHSSIAIILMGKRELVALLNLSSWCLVMVERLFLAVPRGCLRFAIVVFPDHTHLLFLGENENILIPSNSPKIGKSLVQLMRMAMSIWLKWIQGDYIISHGILPFVEQNRTVSLLISVHNTMQFT